VKALGDVVRVTRGFRRSMHVERDAGRPLSDTYIPTTRAVHTLRRLTQAMTDDTRGRAWSITGPYGTGKSSFALFVDALLGPPGPLRAATTATLANADPDLVAQLEAGRARFDPTGEFTRAVATSRREPVTATIIRALRHGVERRWPTGTPREVADAVRSAEAAGDLGAVLECVKRLSEHGPVLLLIDEFGKNLEYLADDPAAGDLFVLQELAEHATSDADHPLYLVTLQHLAYADYATAAALRPTARREWGKVQGRFEDIAFLDGAEQAGQVISAALDHSAMPAALQRRVRTWAEGSADALRQLGLPPGDRNLLAACYPLHPTVALILPELCARYGQHERTLAGFVASGDPGSVAHFLDRAALPHRGVLPAVRLYDVYAYFVGSSSVGPLGHDTSRWVEIATRLQEVHGLDELDQQILQAVGVLNLIAAGGALRASPALLGFALFDTPEPPGELLARLADLERRGLVTYRAFADEYRLWQGSDFPLRCE